MRFSLKKCCTTCKPRPSPPRIALCGTRTLVNETRDLWQRAFYFLRIQADPADRDVVYSLNFTLMKSTDGGRTFVNLPAGHRTTTIESKTNFLGAAPLGSRVTGECTPVHRGRTTMVWQTRVTSEAGKLVALVTQTQMVIPAAP